MKMLTGALPFFDPNPVRLALKQITAPIPDIMVANPKLPQVAENLFSGL